MPLVGSPVAERMHEQAKRDAEILRNFSLSRMLQPEISESYRGKDIRFPNLGMGPEALGSLLSLLDPTGMIGGPAGFVFEAKAPMWLGKSTQPEMYKSLLDEMKAYGKHLEEYFPRLGAATKKTPVNLLETMGAESPKGSLGHYLPRSPEYREGLIELAGVKDFPVVQDNLIHESIHRLQDVDYPAERLSQILWQDAHPNVRDTFGNVWSHYTDQAHQMGYSDEVAADIVDKLLAKEYMSELGARPDFYKPSHASVVEKYLGDLSGVENLYGGQTLFEEPFGLGELLKSHGIGRQKTYAEELAESFASRHPNKGKEAFRKMGLK